MDMLVEAYQQIKNAKLQHFLDFGKLHEGVMVSVLQHATGMRATARHDLDRLEMRTACAGRELSTLTVISEVRGRWKALHCIMKAIQHALLFEGFGGGDDDDDNDDALLLRRKRTRSPGRSAHDDEHGGCPTRMPPIDKCKASDVPNPNTLSDCIMYARIYSQSLAPCMHDGKVVSSCFTDPTTV